MDSDGRKERRAPARYRRIALLGQGGMAKVFLTVCPGPAGVNKLLVSKELRPELLGDPDVQTMFLDEARLAARLNHPNVVQTYEVGKHDDDGHDGAERYFLAMEYLEGQPLNRIQSKVPRALLTLEARLRILVDVLAGLHYAHELTDFDGTPLDVVHRDVSPANVFVTYDGHVKLVDFGIAKARGAVGLTRNGIFKGKVTYAAPEQVLGHKLDRRADIFPVGVMLWEAITGRRMWPGLSEIAILLELTSGRIPSLREACPSVSPQLEDICLRALAMSPADRFATAEDLRRALEQVLHASYGPVETAAIGHVLAHHFREDRARIRGEIEAQIKLVASDPWREPVTSSMPVLALEDSQDSDIADAPSNGAFVQGSVRPSDPREAGTGEGASSGRAAAGWARSPRVIAAGVALAVCVTGALVALGRPGAPAERGTSNAAVAPPREDLPTVVAPSADAIVGNVPPTPGAVVAAAARVDPAPPVQPAELAPPEPLPRARSLSPSSPPRRAANASTRRAAAPAVASARPPAGDDDAPEIRPMKPKLSVDEQDPYAK
jgi:serine/threonine protein kinase